MLVLILGLVLFLGMHAVTMKRDLRAQLIERFGAGGYRGLYSAVSLIGFGLLIYGYGLQRAAGYTVVWEPPVWTRHLALLLNLPIFILLAVGRRPSWLLSRVKHPMLLAVKIWATAHLLANGDLGSILLFGGFLAWATALFVVSRKRDRAAGVSYGKGKPVMDAVVVVVGLVAWAAFAFYLHGAWIGVKPMGV